MIVDSSALLAILFQEGDALQFEQAIGTATNCRMSVANALEASIVLENRGGSTVRDDFDSFLDISRIELVPVTIEHFDSARRAWRRFGKGNHPAALNFGDCFAYALAETTGEPLLFKGNDFVQTDITPAFNTPTGN